MNTATALVNRFIHDLATGTWLGVFYLILSIQRRLGGATPPVQSALVALQQDLFRFGALLLAVIFATGFYYLYRFLRYEDLPAEADAPWKVRILVAKHFLLTLAFFAGTAVEYLIAFR